MKIKKIIKLINIVIILLLLFSSNVMAFTIDENVYVSTIYDSILGYHYEGEERSNYKQFHCNGTPVYTFNRNNNNSSIVLSNSEIYDNEKCRRILENGYPIKSYAELKVNSDQEAYFATQEAIYVLFEEKDINKYITENDSGKRIISATKKILENATQKEVDFSEVASDWQIDETNDKYKYKEFKVTLLPEIKNAVISLQNVSDVSIKNRQNEIVTNVEDGDIIKIVATRGMNQDFQVKISYEKQSAILSQCYYFNSPNKKYLISESGDVKKEALWDISFQNLAKVIITNYDNNTKNAISESSFEILNDSQHVIKNNLTTNENGTVETMLEKGKYFIRQTNINEEYALASNLIEFEITQIEDVNLNVYNSEIIETETTQEKEEVNISEETEKVTENHVTNVTNVHNKNVEKEIIKQTNETNFENTNYFVNTIYRKNINNITKENIYNNEAWEETVQSKVLPGVNRTTRFVTEEFLEDMKNIERNVLTIPSLPIAVRE